MKIKFYSDAGHGWAAVKRQTLINLGIENKITRYSHQRGATVYLEEDLDYSTLVAALKLNNIEYQVVHKYVDHSPIRSYQFYVA